MIKRGITRHNTTTAISALDAQAEILGLLKGEADLSSCQDCAFLVKGFGSDELRIMKRSGKGAHSISIIQGNLEKAIRHIDSEAGKFILITKHMSKILKSAKEAEMYLYEIATKGINFILHPYPQEKPSQLAETRHKFAIIQHETLLPRRVSDTGRRGTMPSIMKCREDRSNKLNSILNSPDRNAISTIMKKVEVVNSPTNCVRFKDNSKSLENLKRSQSYVKLKLNMKEIESEEIVEQLIFPRSPSLKHLRYKDWKFRTENKQQYPHDDVYAMLINKHKDEVKRKSDAAIKSMKRLRKQMQHLIEGKPITPKFIISEAIKHVWLKDDENPEPQRAQEDSKPKLLNFLKLSMNSEKDSS
jgi:hypothetical protein